MTVCPVHVTVLYGLQSGAQIWARLGTDTTPDRRRQRLQQYPVYIYMQPVNNTPDKSMPQLVAFKTLFDHRPSEH